jgi:hypothetical protein
MSDDGERTPRLSEPLPVDCHFIEGVTIEVRDQFIRVVGWIDLETVEMSEPERRIVLRAAMPTMLARELIRDLRKAVARGGD